MKDIIKLFEEELNTTLTEKETAYIEDLNSKHTTKNLLKALKKAVYNNYDLLIIEKILNEVDLSDCEDYDISEVLNNNEDKTKVELAIEDRFKRQLTLLERYIIKEKLSNYSEEKIKQALYSKRLEKQLSLHMLVEVLRFNKLD